MARPRDSLDAGQGDVIHVLSAKFKIQNSKFKTQNSKLKIQNSKFKTQNSKFTHPSTHRNALTGTPEAAQQSIRDLAGFGDAQGQGAEAKHPEANAARDRQLPEANEKAGVAHHLL